MRERTFDWTEEEEKPREIHHAARVRKNVEIRIDQSQSQAFITVYELLNQYTTVGITVSRKVKDITRSILRVWAPKLAGAEIGQRVRFTAYLLNEKGSPRITHGVLMTEVICARVVEIVGVSGVTQYAQSSSLHAAEQRRPPWIWPAGTRKKVFF